MLKKTMADGATNKRTPVMARMPGPDTQRWRPAEHKLPPGAHTGRSRAPMLSVDRNGILLEANKPGLALLELLGREVGERLPDYITQLIPGVLLSGLSEKEIVECQGKNLAITIALCDDPKVERLTLSSSSRRALVLVDSRESEASALHELPVALYTSRQDREEGEDWISPGVEELTGFSPSNFTSGAHFWISRIHPDDRPGVVQELMGLRGRRKASLEYRFLCADGTYRWLMDNIVASGSKKAFGIMQDIDARKLRELAARGCNEFLEMLVDCASHGVMVLDEDHNLLFMNPKFAEKLGYATRDWVKKQKKLRFHPRDTNVGLEGISNALRGIPGQCKARIRCTDGTYLYVQLFMSPLAWRQRRLVMCVAGDITVEKRAELERNASIRMGMEDLVRSAVTSLAPELAPEEAMRRIRRRLGEPGKALLEMFGED